MQGIQNINMNSDIFTKGIDNSFLNKGEVLKENSTNIKFDEVIENAINEVNNSQVNADNKIQSFIKGEDVAMHDVMLAMQESQMSMQLMIEVRNKIFEAYQEVNRVQL